MEINDCIVTNEYYEEVAHEMTKLAFVLIVVFNLKWLHCKICIVYSGYTKVDVMIRSDINIHHFSVLD